MKQLSLLITKFRPKSKSVVETIREDEELFRPSFLGLCPFPSIIGLRISKVTSAINTNRVINEYALI